MVLQVKKNSFYRRDMISTSGAVKLSAAFKDLAMTEATYLTLSGASNATRVVFSGSVPEDPQFGGGVLTGGWLNVTPQDTDLSLSAKLPQVASYRIKDDTEVVEGGMELMTSHGSLPTGSPTPPRGGGSIMVMNAWHDETIPF